jgi:hypothetical protein
MKIELKKFGTTLISRQAGQEALAAFNPSLNNLRKNEIIEVDFSGVKTFSPSWGDEFLRPLYERFGNNFFLINTNNLSVKITLELLEESNKIKFILK